MATLCLDANPEILRPLCCRHTLLLQEDLCRCLHKGSPQALQAVVTLLSHHVLQKSPHFIVQGFEVCTPRKPVLCAHGVQKVPSQPPLRCLGFLLRNVSHLLVARPLDTLGHQFHPFRAKMKA